MNLTCFRKSLLNQMLILTFENYWNQTIDVRRMRLRVMLKSLQRSRSEFKKEIEI